ncbi:MAG: hypothetical protein GKR90_00950 [Pseudomonadales bacterium]|nr:hypothetical protein [Pseudomonadales bacterium]
MTSLSVDYSIAQKVIHWVMSLLLILDLFVAQKFDTALEDWDRFESRSDHATLGTIVAVLFIYRLYLRFRYGAPPLPDAMPAWQQKAARWGHITLYLLIGVLVTSGIATAINATSEITLFASFVLTSGQSDGSLFQTLRPIHEFATNAIIVLIAAHFLAALYHQFFEKDQVLKKMLIFWRRIPHQED